MVKDTTALIIAGAVGLGAFLLLGGETAEPVRSGIGQTAAGFGELFAGFIPSAADVIILNGGSIVPTQETGLATGLTGGPPIDLRTAIEGPLRFIGPRGTGTPSGLAPLPTRTDVTRPGAIVMPPIFRPGVVPIPPAVVFRPGVVPLFVPSGTLQ